MQDFVGVDGKDSLIRVRKILEAEREDDVQKMTEVVNEIKGLEEISDQERVNLDFARDYFEENDYEGLAKNAEEGMMKRSEPSDRRTFPLEITGYIIASTAYEEFIDITQKEIFGFGDEVIAGALGIAVTWPLAKKYVPGKKEVFDVEEAIDSNNVYAIPKETFRETYLDSY